MSEGHGVTTPCPSLRGSDRADVLRLRTLLALGHVVLDALVLLERLVAVALDGGVVAEDVGAAVVLGDEAETLLRVEPLHSALCHSYFFFRAGVTAPTDAGA